MRTTTVPSGSPDVTRRPRHARDAAGRRTTEVAGHYRRHKLGAEALAVRNLARRQIVSAASAVAMADGRPPYSARHLQRCVAIARHRGLVASGMLVLAGFNP